jgi:hypothetical protein
VVQVSTSQQVGKDVTSTDVLDQIFTMEKNLALGLFQQLGVQLSAADRQALETRPTRSLQAFLAYSNGLMAEDEGRFGDAARFFDQARTIDPGFGQALQRANSARAAQQGQQVTAAQVESNLKSSSEGAATAGTGGVGATLANAVGDVNPSAANSVNTSTGGSGGGGNNPPPTTRDATAEKTGTDQPAAKNGVITLIIRRP